MYLPWLMSCCNLSFYLILDVGKIGTFLEILLGPYFKSGHNNEPVKWQSYVIMFTGTVLKRLVNDSAMFVLNYIYQMWTCAFFLCSLMRLGACEGLPLRSDQQLADLSVALPALGQRSTLKWLHTCKVAITRRQWYNMKLWWKCRLPTSACTTVMWPPLLFKYEIVIPYT